METESQLSPPDKVNILGVGVDPINMKIATDRINRWVDSETSHYVCVTPVHSIMDCQSDPDLRHIFNRASMVTPDGMPVVWICNWLGQHRTERVYGPDLLLEVCANSQANGHRHFFYGGHQGVADQLADVLQKRFPKLQVAGTYSPPFGKLSAEEDARIVDHINQCRPDIVWVGLGSPKQERWMADHVDSLPGIVQIGIGAAFDFHTGRIRQAPFWMQRSGLEWFFRLIMEPRRLWRRYLVGNSLFLFNLAMQRTGLRTYPLS